MKPETFICAVCGEAIPLAQEIVFDGQSLCRDCFEAETVLCHDCGERIWADDNAGNENLPLCQSCYERSYTHCTHCGVLMRESDIRYGEDDVGEEEDLCYDCYVRTYKARCIQDYSYKPEPIFYGDGPRYFGVELEIDEGGERDENARHLIRTANGNGLEHLYIKHDGSLESGLELVSHPMALNYHMSEMPWASILAEAVRMGYTSHQAQTCGLHIHINRNALGATETSQEDVIARILFFVENHWNELLRFSRRSRAQMERWAARYGRKDDPKAVLDHAKKKQFERYTCVNLTNCNTIEFRMFRGTLKLNTFLATLQMVDRICNVAFYLSDQEMQELTWIDFVAGCTAPELIQYLKERRLYVNEPIETEAEV